MSATTPRGSEITTETVGRFRAAINDSDGCWRWTGARSSAGYGVMTINDRYILAHRFSYAAFRGEIPEGMQIDHLCRVRECANPDHLEAVTLRENVLRGFSAPAVNARKTHCDSGHEFTAENTKPIKGGRACRECDREATRKWRAAVPPKPLTPEQKARRAEGDRRRRAAKKALQGGRP